jgi:uncharacterized protein (DUF362 family)/Pyruvate/2-oxoacid:ferredoxin oxidoreductase delta subunit
MKSFVSKGNRVLIKPNLLLAKDPKYAITTHPSVLGALVKEVRSCGGTPLIGDSPGAVLKGLERVWKKTGLMELAQDLDVELLNFEKGGVIQKNVNGERYPISRFVFDVDVIINVPKLKTHNLTRFTGGIKNLFGCLPGLTKANFHKKYPNPRSFAKALVDILEIIPPHLNVMDGVLGMDGEGPSLRGRKREYGVILASIDTVALDAVAAQIIGFEDNSVDTIRFAQQRKLGVGDLRKIDIVGGSISDFVLIDPHIPSNWKFQIIPDPLGRLIGRFVWLHPVVDQLRCVQCLQCVTSCPVQAISQNEGRKLEFNYRECINCLCCQEMCPEGAIKQKGSVIARLINRSI